MVPDLAAAGGVGTAADGEPSLGEVALFEDVAGGGAAHSGGYPAGIDRVADDVRPAAGEGEVKRGDEELAVAVGLGAVPAAGGPVEVMEAVVAADVHVAAAATAWLVVAITSVARLISPRRAGSGSGINWLVAT